MALEDQVRQGVGPRLLLRISMVRVLVMWNFGSLARWVRGSIPPLALHCTTLVADLNCSRIHFAVEAAPAQTALFFLFCMALTDNYVVFV